MNIETNGEPVANSRISEDYEELITNATINDLLSRVRNRISDVGNRDVDKSCGYPVNPDIGLFKHLYEREPLATRLVEFFPTEAWSSPPIIRETEDEGVASPFEQDWQMLPRGLTTSFYNPEEFGASLLWQQIKQANILARVCEYSIILLGYNDTDDLSLPVRPELASDKLRLLFIRVLDQTEATIEFTEKDQHNSRYGQPTFYKIEGNIRVHWTRVIHVVDSGKPFMQPVLNTLLNIRKISGAASEGFWLGAFAGHAFSTPPTIPNAKINVTQTKEMIRDYQWGMERFILLKNLIPSSLAPQVSDPTPQLNTQIDILSAYAGIPKRILMGSERGDLASSQDETNLNNRLNEYRINTIIPNAIVPFIDRQIMFGVLSKPKSYFVKWSDELRLTPNDQLDIGKKQADLLAMFVEKNLQTIIPLREYMVKICGFTDAQAETLVNDKPAVVVRVDTPETTVKTETKSPFGGVGVQDTALNGAQITSLLLVTDAVAAKRYPAEAAVKIVQAAFPSMDITLIRAFVDTLARYNPPSSALAPELTSEGANTTTQVAPPVLPAG